MMINHTARTGAAADRRGARRIPAVVRVVPAPAVVLLVPPGSRRSFVIFFLAVPWPSRATPTVPLLARLAAALDAELDIAFRPHAA